ncbi:SDR family NAD(P)-dependent oxidoreductase [Terriglobus tenax]|uniref:SDR family NAD(P)-dependent oxidoreductase n=1 Tax=Terriglobus tenax TaxID=1111115 RepID=UPI0021E06DCA|nr:glucose 1-dehydrogenase [Terriglobus tenax]
MGRLANKVAVVTGASKGIGAAIAKDLAKAGATVVVNYASSREGAEKVVAEITKAGGKAVAIGGRVENKAEVETLFAEVKKQFGKVDVLVNNAGVYGFSPLEAITAEEFQRQYGVNVLGLLQVTQAAVPLFPAEGGSIVNISSVVKTGGASASVYAGTKGAVDTITFSLAKELAPKKIRVNSVNPGLVETEGTAGFMGSDFEKDVVSKTPLGRVGQPDDIAPVVTFFASDDARWVTGETLFVSGGVVNV